MGYFCNMKTTKHLPFKPEDPEKMAIDFCSKHEDCFLLPKSLSYIIWECVLGKKIYIRYIFYRLKYMFLCILSL